MEGHGNMGMGFRDAGTARGQEGDDSGAVMGGVALINKLR